MGNFNNFIVKTAIRDGLLLTNDLGFNSIHIGVAARKSNGHLVRRVNRKLKGGATKEMETEAVFLGTRLAIENEREQVEIKLDSEVVINQLRGTVHH